MPIRCLFLLAILFAAVSAAAQTQIRILNPQPAGTDRYGAAVATDGYWMLVGVPGDDTTGGAAAGAVYVYRWQQNGFVQITRLTASDGAANDQFGSAVAISGDIAVVGAPQDDLAQGSSAGSAYVFQRVGNDWQQRAKLIAPDASTSDAFGTAVAASGGAIVVGAAFDDVTGVGQNAGTAHVFSGGDASWNHVAQLIANDGDQFDRFGFAVGIAGDHILVGAPQANATAGASYAYRRNGSSVEFQAKLVASDAAASADFGSAIAMDGAAAVIGASQLNGSIGTNAGAAYVFTRSASTWTQQAKLLNTATRAGDQYGYAVALRGDVAVIGARFADIAPCCNNAGTATVFQHQAGQWTLLSQLTASNGALSDELGTAVAVFPRGIVAGAPQSNDPSGSVDSGSLMQFTLALPIFRDGFE